MDDPNLEFADAVGENVLLVDDESAVRLLIAFALRNIGFQILQAADGEQALALVERHLFKIRLLICDVMMPGMTGPNVVTRVWDRLPDLPVLIVSASHGRIDMPAPIAEKASFLAKPFDLSVLLRMVTTLLSDDNHGSAQEKSREKLSASPSHREASSAG